MEDNNVMIFQMRADDKLESIGLFTAADIASLNVEVEAAKKAFHDYSWLAIDMEARRLVATTAAGVKATYQAEYVNEQYFLDKGSVLLDVEGSLTYSDAKYICRREGELLWYRVATVEEEEDDVKKAWRAKNPNVHLPVIKKNHVPPYVFNWTQYAHFGTRQSKITLFFLGYDTSNIKEVDETRIVV